MNLTIREIVSGFRLQWKSLFATDIVFQIISLVVLTPIVAFVIRAFVSFSGYEVLTDLQLVQFFTSIWGLICFVFVFALGATIEAFGLVSLLLVIASGETEKRRVLKSLRLAFSKAVPIFRVAIRMAAQLLLYTIPLILIGAFSYFSFLGEHDINYYLKYRPTEFWWAAMVIGTACCGIIAVLFTFLTRWFSIIPLVVFEQKSPQDALILSSARSKGTGRTIAIWFSIWFASLLIASWAFNGCLILFAKFWIPRVSTSLLLLEISLCIFLLFQFLVNVFLNLLGSATFALVYFKLYERLYGKELQISETIDSVEATSNESRLKITNRRLILFGLLGFVIACSFNFLAILSIPMEDDVVVIAHRGASKSAPENTLASIEQAIVDGADSVEIDVQEIADGEVVVYHDKDFMRLAETNLNIWDATLEDLESIDIGSSFDPKFDSERVPTLREVLEKCKNRVQLTIELKTYGKGVMLEKRVAALVEETEMVDQSVFMSLSQSQVKEMQRIRPNWNFGLLMSVSSGKINDLDVDFLAVNSKFATYDFISKAHKSGKKVYAWTVNDPEKMATLVNRDIDGLITDRPALARKFLDERKTLTTPERLLLRFAGQWGLAPSIDLLNEQE